MALHDELLGTVTLSQPMQFVTRDQSRAVSSLTSPGLCKLPCAKEGYLDQSSTRMLLHLNSPIVGPECPLKT